MEVTQKDIFQQAEWILWNITDILFHEQLISTLSSEAKEYIY